MKLSLSLLSFGAFISISAFAANPDGLDAILGADSNNSKSPIATSKSAGHKTNPERNIDLVIKSLKDNYGLDAEKNFGDSYCPNSNYCEALVGPIHIQAIGFSVDVLPSVRSSPNEYLKVCSSVLQALSGSNINLAEASVTNAFKFASANGSAASKLGTTDFKVVSQSNGLLKCSAVLIRR